MPAGPVARISRDSSSPQGAEAPPALSAPPAHRRRDRAPRQDRRARGASGAREPPGGSHDPRMARRVPVRRPPHRRTRCADHVHRVPLRAPDVLFGSDAAWEEAVSCWITLRSTPGNRGPRLRRAVRGRRGQTPRLMGHRRVVCRPLVLDRPGADRAVELRSSVAGASTVTHASRSQPSEPPSGEVRWGPPPRNRATQQLSLCISRDASRHVASDRAGAYWTVRDHTSGCRDGPAPTAPRQHARRIVRRPCLSSTALTGSPTASGRRVATRGSVARVSPTETHPATSPAGTRSRCHMPSPSPRGRVPVGTAAVNERLPRIERRLRLPPRGLPARRRRPRRTAWRRGARRQPPPRRRGSRPGERC